MLSQILENQREMLSLLRKNQLAESGNGENSVEEVEDYLQNPCSTQASFEDLNKKAVEDTVFRNKLVTIPLIISKKVT